MTRIACSFILSMRNVWDKSCRENQKHILCSITFCENRAVHNSEKYCGAGQATDDNKMRRIRIPCWIPKTTNTHSQYVILIAFLLQQWLHERASVLRYTYIACHISSVCISATAPGILIVISSRFSSFHRPPKRTLSKDFSHTKPSVCLLLLQLVICRCVNR